MLTEKEGKKSKTKGPHIVEVMDNIQLLKILGS